VLTQDYPNLEYLVMDGGSTNQTLDVLKRYSGRVTWFNEKDEGQTNAINKGLCLAGGDLLAYLNADDLLLPGTLFKVAQTAARNLQAMWFTGQCRIIDDRGNEIRKPVTTYKNLLLRSRSFSLLAMTNYISQPSTFWRREALQEVGLLDENLHYVMDYEYWLRLYSKYPPIFIPAYLASFKIHPASKTTSTGHKDVYITEERDILRRHTHSRILMELHNAHRTLMTLVYSLMNREK
jgi:glycosyltransferase involved in cell wall biosynthesis